MLGAVRALEWPDGYLDRLLAGEVTGPPSRADSPSRPSDEELPSDLPLAVAHELKQGPLIDSQVVELGDDSNARVIVVLRGDDSMTPEQVESAIKAWRRFAKQLRMGETHSG